MANRVVTEAGVCRLRAIAEHALELAGHGLEDDDDDELHGGSVLDVVEVHIFLPLATFVCRAFHFDCRATVHYSYTIFDALYYIEG